MNIKRTPPHTANLLDTASPSANHTHTTFHTHLYTHTPSHLPAHLTSHLTSHLTLYLTSQLISHLTPPVITSHSYIRLFSMHHPCTVSRAPDLGLFPGPGSRPGTDVECPRPGNAPFRAPERFAVHSGPASGPRNAFRGPDPGRGPDPARIRGPAVYSVEMMAPLVRARRRQMTYRPRSQLE